MTGKIIKGIGGFYYVVCENGVTYECKAKGVFRNRKIKPLVGDNVEIEILDAEKNLGNIEDILPRFNWLNRPAVANVDQTVIIFAVSAPAPNFNLLDRFLINMEQHEVPTIICFNKIDLEGFRQSEDICRSYTKSGYEVLFISAEKDEIKNRLLLRKNNGGSELQKDLLSDDKYLDFAIECMKRVLSMLEKKGIKYFVIEEREK